MKRTLPLLAALLALAAVCSCNSNTGNTNDTGETGNANGDTSDSEYTYPELSFGGDEILISNMVNLHTGEARFVIPSDDTDETLNAAMYESNMRIEERFDCKLVEDLYPKGVWEEQFIDHANAIIRNLMSGEDTYDFIYYPINNYTGLITEGYLRDLSELDGFQFDKPWWDTQLLGDIMINDRLYMASGAINVNPYNCMETVIFNKEIILANRLDNPYDMVRDGTWTIDALYTLANECKTLFTDPHWWILAGEGGTSTYGTGMERGFPMHMLTGAGIKFVTEANGDYSLSFESDDFYLALEKMKPLFTHCDSGGVGGGDASSSNNSRTKLFMEGRVAFCFGTVAEGCGMRDVEFSYGYLPIPKLREEQENYYTGMNDIVRYLAIPTVNERADDVSKLLDAMAYDRYKNVIPVYYDSYLTYKGVRDEDSIEMIEIMTEGRTVDFGIAYGLCRDLVLEQISYKFPNGNIASTIASYKDPVNDRIDAFINEFLD